MSTCHSPIAAGVALKVAAVAIYHVDNVRFLSSPLDCGKCGTCCRPITPSATPSTNWKPGILSTNKSQGTGMGILFCKTDSGWSESGKFRLESGKWTLEIS